MENICRCYKNSFALGCAEFIYNPEYVPIKYIDEMGGNTVDYTGIKIKSY